LNGFAIVANTAACLRAVRLSIQQRPFPQWRPPYWTSVRARGAIHGLDRRARTRASRMDHSAALAGGM